MLGSGGTVVKSITAPSSASKSTNPYATGQTSSGAYVDLGTYNRQGYTSPVTPVASNYSTSGYKDPSRGAAGSFVGGDQSRINTAVGHLANSNAAAQGLDYNSLWQMAQGLSQSSGAYDQATINQRMADIDSLRGLLGGGGGGGGGPNAGLINAETDLRKRLLDLQGNDINRAEGMANSQLGHIGYLWDLASKGYDSTNRDLNSQRTNIGQTADMDIADTDRNTNAQIESLLRQYGFDTSQLQAKTGFDISNTQRNLGEDIRGISRDASNTLRAMLSDATTRGATLSRGYGQGVTDVNQNRNALENFLTGSANANINELNRNMNDTMSFWNRDVNANTQLLQGNQQSANARTNLQRAYQMGLIDENQLRLGLQKDAEHNQAIQQIEGQNNNLAGMPDQRTALDIQKQLLDLQAQGALSSGGGGGGGAANVSQLLSLMQGQWGLQDQSGQLARQQQQDAMGYYGMLASNPSLAGILPQNQPPDLGNSQDLSFLFG